jgi:hypothetical protein
MEPIALELQTPQDPVANWWQQIHFGEHAIDSFKTALAAALSLGRFFEVTLGILVLLP